MASTGTLCVPVSPPAGPAGHDRGGAVQSQELYGGPDRLLEFSLPGSPGDACQCIDRAGDAGPGVLPAAEGLLVRTGRIFVAGLRRCERLHSAQPDDALHGGGSDGVRDGTGHRAELSLHRVHHPAGLGAGGCGHRPDPAVLEGAPQHPACADALSHRCGGPGGLRHADGRRLRCGIRHGRPVQSVRESGLCL